MYDLDFCDSDDVDSNEPKLNTKFSFGLDKSKSANVQCKHTVKNE